MALHGVYEMLPLPYNKQFSTVWNFSQLIEQTLITITVSSLMCEGGGVLSEKIRIMVIQLCWVFIVEVRASISVCDVSHLTKIILLLSINFSISVSLWLPGVLCVYADNQSPRQQRSQGQ